ncbi:MAG: DNA-processing protein DprA [Candidatus Omnitrophica bacterium]|nr:DNA-processing protein DprA [Candidatus Omnitrophota bacterium]
MNENIYWIALSLIGISPLKVKMLMERFKDIKEIFSLSVNDLVQLGITEKIAEKISKWENLPLEKEIDYIEKEGINVITIKDKNYPNLLKEIYDPPFLLYVKGNLNFNEFSISIVGTRNPSHYGLKMAEKFASELASIGFTIVSGLARGIDTSAHIGALRVNGVTVGVLGSGFNYFYPPENKRIEKEIIKKGAIITEFPSLVPPEKYNFPKRNRIISGLSKATIVIEAGPKSGALITANFALEQGREVFALPGRIDTVYSKGTHKLLKDGAILIENVQDILEALNIKVEKKEKHMELEANEENIILKILDRPLHIEEIMVKTKIKPENLFSILTKLQIEDKIEELPGKIYRKKNF